MQYLKNPIILYVVIVLLLLTNCLSVCYFLFIEKSEECTNEIVYSEPGIEVEEEIDYIKVDIKGYVKKPGVYQLENGAIVNDLIKLAGGLKSSGTTENINLSKKLTDEAMVIISSKKELKKTISCETTKSTTNISKEQEVINNTTTDTIIGGTDNSSVNTDSSSNSNKISLNNATQEELMTLSGIGEKTALKIIEYRATKKFESIEDIKNVSGIGDSLFEKIKDYITI